MAPIVVAEIDESGAAAVITTEESDAHLTEEKDTPTKSSQGYHFGGSSSSKHP